MLQGPGHLIGNEDPITFRHWSQRGKFRRKNYSATQPHCPHQISIYSLWWENARRVHSHNGRRPQEIPKAPKRNRNTPGEKPPTCPYYLQSWSSKAPTKGTRSQNPFFLISFSISDPLLPFENHLFSVPGTQSILGYPKTSEADNVFQQYSIFFIESCYWSVGCWISIVGGGYHKWNRIAKINVHDTY